MEKEGRVQRVRTAPSWMRDCVTPTEKDCEENLPTPKKRGPLVFDFEMEEERRNGNAKASWSEEEDALLVEAITKVADEVAKARRGPVWSKVSEMCNMNRTGKQCRERWVNHLDPALDWSPWREEEDAHILREYAEWGSCWARIAKGLEGRSDNMVKNRFASSLFKQFGMLESPRPAKRPKAERGLSKYYQKKRKEQAARLESNLDEILEEFSKPAEMPTCMVFDAVNVDTGEKAEPVQRTGLFTMTIKAAGEAVQKPPKQKRTLHVKTKGYLQMTGRTNVFAEMNKKMHK